MENTIENKVKFFAQHWGQEVQRVIMSHSKPICKVGNYLDWDDINEDFLELISLSELSDEDAIEVGKLNGSITDNDKLVGHSLVYWLHKKGTNRDITFEAIDYLRSKGYAVPYMGLSVEKLIEYGWIKLKNKS